MSLRRWGVVVGIVLALLGLSVRAVGAEGPPPVADPPPMDDQVCLACHEKEGLTMVLPSGGLLPVTVDAEALRISAHGDHASQEVHCQDCHSDLWGYPHGDPPVQDYRDLVIYYSQSCANCHEEEAQKRVDSVHARAMAAGVREAATCVDCHGGHDVRWIAREKHPEVPRTLAVEVCHRCHSGIYEEYRRSIHGRDLYEGNKVVPNCITCHPAHTIEDPRTLAFRLKSPQLCGQCHADKKLMAQYGISTAVFDTYVADFHGTTVLIFEKTTPDQPTNKAVCTDCHGAHAILTPEEAGYVGVKSNLVETCRQCHPDASASFANSWVGHYRPDWGSYPIVTGVTWFYRILIPTVLGFFLLYIALDVQQRLRKRLRRARS
ncbi:MAG TPA: hypothetical protein ENK56_00435 [Chloroflexi bacterium]|nr:hypothetical protein [Chloroflexota bacterium]